MKEVVKKEVLKLLDVGVIYPITDSKWVSPTQLVPKKFGVTVVTPRPERVYGTCNRRGAYVYQKIFLII